MTRVARISHAARARRGSVYLFALGACGLVVVAGVTAVRISRVGLSSQAISRDADRASREADAAMHLVAQMVTDDPSGVVWRADAQHLVKIDDLTGASAGSIAQTQITFTDPVDNDLRDDATEQVRASVVAVVGDVQRSREFEVQPVVTNLACLSHTLIFETIDVLAGKTLRFAGTQAVVTGGPAAPRVLNSAAVKKSRGIDVSGVDSVASPSAVFLPTVDSIIAAFRNRGASEVTLSANLTLDKELISPNRFTPGSTNPQGLYIINANGHRVVIRDSRIDASLVIYNAANAQGVKLEGAIAMEPAFAGLPSLVVGGDVEMEQTSADLLESSAARNLNPSGAPYLGATDADTLDSYPSLINGLVYVDGSLNVSGSVTILGQLFVSGELKVNEQLIIRPDPIETANPVPGFSMPTAMRLVPESVSGN
jgi:hypothetical protein